MKGDGINSLKECGAIKDCTNVSSFADLTPIFNEIYEKANDKTTEVVTYTNSRGESVAIKFEKINEILNSGALNSGALGSDAEKAFQYLKDSGAITGDETVLSKLMTFKDLNMFVGATLQNKVSVGPKSFHRGGSKEEVYLLVLANIESVKELRRVRFQTCDGCYNSMSEFLRSVGITKDNIGNIENCISVPAHVSPTNQIDGGHFFNLTADIKTLRDRGGIDVVDNIDTSKPENKFLCCYDTARLIGRPEETPTYDFGDMAKFCKYVCKIQQKDGSCPYHTAVSTVTMAKNEELVDKIFKDTTGALTYQPEDRWRIKEKEIEGANSGLTEIEIAQLAEFIEVVKNAGVGKVSFGVSGDPKNIWDIVVREEVKEKIVEDCKSYLREDTELGKLRNQYGNDIEQLEFTTAIQILNQKILNQQSKKVEKQEEKLEVISGFLQAQRERNELRETKQKEQQESQLQNEEMTTTSSMPPPVATPVATPVVKPVAKLVVPVISKNQTIISKAEEEKALMAEDETVVDMVTFPSTSVSQTPPPVATPPLVSGSKLLGTLGRSVSTGRKDSRSETDTVDKLEPSTSAVKDVFDGRVSTDSKSSYSSFTSRDSSTEMGVGGCIGN
ncbi:hypothetical protein FACS1894152_5710 [Bacilli bacterium]|nr:hypothetical protein FACS1894152_5710 [Bacilli bacterium]